ncbi:hypothetical protein, partial [Devosia sp.]|uniref:hypothetical protein n=1 Tax=Devosia sp. TaxID=1871048 RepID=UPI002AFEFBAE
MEFTDTRLTVSLAFQYAYDAWRALMVNLGFGDVIKKFEEYFGKRITSIFLSIIGVCFIILVVGYTVNTILAPLFIYILSLVIGSEDVKNLVTGVNIVGAVLSIGAIFLLSLDARRTRKNIIEVKEKISEADRMHEELKSASDEIRIGRERIDYISLHLKDILNKIDGSEEAIKELMAEDDYLKKLRSEPKSNLSPS